MASEPMATSCDNPGWRNHWTSPCCYADLPNVNPGTVDCPECGRSIVCTLIEQPVCRAELADENTEEEGEDDENI